MATATPRSRGPWTFRWLVNLLTVALGVLVYWLVGFLIDDLGRWPGPDFSAIEARTLDPTLVAQAAAIRSDIDDIDQRLSEARSRQAILRDSTASSQDTMRQLLEFQKLGLERNVTPSDAEKQALADSQALFLNNQREYQTINEQIAVQTERQNQLNTQLRELETRLSTQRSAAQAEFSRLSRIHDLWTAAAKLVALAPLVALAVWLFITRRGGVYGRLTYAFGIPVALKVMVVMHQYFPEPYFKYIVIFIALAATLRTLVYLLRMIHRPGVDWLQKQYREAYEAFLCPICQFPIRRGPLKYMAWTQRSLLRIAAATAASTEPEQPYTCPNCATRLFAECQACHQVRYALLPACPHCGDVQPLTEPLGDLPDSPQPRPASTAAMPPPGPESPGISG